MSITVRTLLIASSLLAASASAKAQSDEQSNTPGPRWLVNCNNQANPDVLACAMSQSILQANTRQRIVTASIFKNPQAEYSMRLQLPHGLDLNKGVTLAIDDGTATPHKINTADANGSYALVPLDATLVDAMKAGNIAVIGISNVNGNDINLEISLNGFSSSFGLLVN